MMAAGKDTANREPGIDLRGNENRCGGGDDNRGGEVCNQARRLGMIRMKMSKFSPLGRRGRT